ncbi:MAG TPA: ABC transporter permease [Gammaproteobacteria bacterium]|nr:ABC transporter permease [Gammaproteobacteria bacterium]
MTERPDSTARRLREARRSRGFAAKVSREVLAQWGARLGLLWVGLLVVAAVFAPFLANSHPLLVLEEGGWHSPALRFLTAADATLLAAFFTLLLLWPLPLRLRVKLLLFAAVAAVAAVVSHAFLAPPQLTVYEQYREAQGAGRYQRVIYAPIPYSAQDYLRDYGDTGLEPPLAGAGRRHWFGTDENGADVLSRMIHAARIALSIGFVATGIALVIGVIIGGLMGYFSGVVDILGMRLLEIFEAIPVIFLLLTLVAFFGRDLYMMMVIIGLTGWPGFARYVRAEFLRLRQQEFVQAAIACGLPLRSVLFRHMLPNGMAPVLVTLSFSVASAILAEATLSFLGLGPVGEPSWGQMLNQAVQAATFNWWMAVFPGGAIFLTVLAYMLIGEAIRDAIDPYLKKAAR